MDRIEDFSGSEKNEKQRRWDEVTKRVERIVDGLGEHVDAGIREGIVALNALGIHTHGSCEGHVDWGIHSPYIDIQAEIPHELEEEFKRLSKEIDSNRSKFMEVRDEIHRRNLEEQKKIIPYLDAFYGGREVPSGRRLILESSILGRLESQSARFQEIEDEQTKRERLGEYQEEMDAFVSFLKGEYFREEE
jgi:hypothetical protein